MSKALRQGPARNTLSSLFFLNDLELFYPNKRELAIYLFIQRKCIKCKDLGTRGGLDTVLAQVTEKTRSQEVGPGDSMTWDSSFWPLLNL